jgi:hypothetical protein
MAGSGYLRLTKRYFADGRQLATRIDGDLYYHLLDPTGTSLTLADEQGNEAGYVLYDAFGGVLTSTLTAELEAALAGQSAVGDPDTGLVHIGQGRFYDPALGRPLQPNPVGAPPIVPQALNRYSATPLGQPGVAEAAVNGGLLPSWSPGIIAGRASGVGFGLLNEAGTFSREIFGANYTLSVYRFGQKLYDFGPGWQQIDQGFFTKSIDGAVVGEFNRVGIIRALRWVHPEDEFKVVVERTPESGRFFSLNGPGLFGKSILNKAGLVDLGGGVLVAIGAELAFGNYWNDPYLKGWQKEGQFGVAVMGSGVSWGVVAGAGFLVGGPLGVGATLFVAGVTELIWSVAIAPTLNSVAGFDERVRNLQPLGQN